VFLSRLNRQYNFAEIHDFARQYGRPQNRKGTPSWEDVPAGGNCEAQFWQRVPSRRLHKLAPSIRLRMGALSDIRMFHQLRVVFGSTTRLLGKHRDTMAIEGQLFGETCAIGYSRYVTADPVTLSRGQYFGARFRTVLTDSFACAEGEATGSEREIPRHRHASSHFVLVVAGKYITEARNQDRLYGPGTLIYNPVGTTHRDRFRNGRGRFLTITPSADIALLLDARVPVSLVINDVSAITAAARTRRQIFECHCGRALTEFVEDCCLDLAGTISAPCEAENRHVPSWVSQAAQIIRDCCSTGITVRAVANHLGIHPVHLARAFRRYFHLSPSQYVGRCRIWQARKLLVNSTLALAEIAIEVGFSDQSHLTNAFKRETAMTPAAYRSLSRP